MMSDKIQRACENATRHSKDIRMCRRAYSRASARRDRQFWFDWETRLQRSMIACAEMVIRARS